MKIKSLINWKLFGLLLGAGIFSFFAVLPYLLTFQGDALKDLPIPLPIALLLSSLQTTVLLAIFIFFGLLLGKKTDLGAPILSDWLMKRPVKEGLMPLALNAIKLGALAGILIYIGDYIFSFFIEPFEAVKIIPWQAILASFYGGIFEEIFMRLFLVTLIAWVIGKFFKSKNERPTSLSVWVAIITAAIIFGLGHLPATALLTTITPLVITRAILLNGIGGIVFGWLYWKKGLESAMIAHYTADIVILVIIPYLLLLV